MKCIYFKSYRKDLFYFIKKVTFKLPNKDCSEVSYYFNQLHYLSFLLECYIQNLTLMYFLFYFWIIAKHMKTLFHFFFLTNSSKGLAMLNLHLIYSLFLFTNIFYFSDSIGLIRLQNLHLQWTLIWNLHFLKAYFLSKIYKICLLQ